VVNSITDKIWGLSRLTEVLSSDNGFFFSFLLCPLIVLLLF
jgi:hypothetical protein